MRRPALDLFIRRDPRWGNGDLWWGQIPQSSFKASARDFSILFRRERTYLQRYVAFSSQPRIGGVQRDISC